MKNIDTDDASLARYSDTNYLRKQILRTIGLVFSIFLAGAILVPLDEGVPSIASVMVDTRRRPVQHISGGTIKEVLVREGEIVKKGQPLIQLSNTSQAYDYESSKQAYDNFEIHEKNKLLQYHLTKEQLSGVKALVAEGHLAKIREIELEKEYLQIASDLSEIRASLIASRERLRVTKESLDRTLIKSPDDGQIVGLLVQSIGSVVLAGQKLMDIVPTEDRLVIEAKIPPHLIDRIKVGDSADIRFSAFSHSPQLVVSGILEMISNDVLFEDPTGRGAYYLAKVSVTEKGYEQLGHRRLQPGMPAEVVLKTGRRTLLVYILDPIIKRLGVSLKEE